MKSGKTLLLVVMVTFLLGGIADAKPRGRYFFRRPLMTLAPPTAPAAVENPYERQQPQNPPAYWSMEPEFYPQWYGGFHGRMLQNYGYPPGDLGLRGQAW